MAIQYSLTPSRIAQLSAITRHVEFADVLKGFICDGARIAAFSNRGLCLISASAGTGKRNGGISAEGQTTTFAAESAMEGQLLRASLTLNAKPETWVSK